MNFNFGAMVLCFVLGGCAASTSTTSNCTNLISTAGGLLQFCQSANKLAVTESGIDVRNEAEEIQVVRDPVTLNALVKQLVPRQSFKLSRHLVARACVIKGKTYVNISLADLRRMMSRPQIAVADEPGMRVP